MLNIGGQEYLSTLMKMERKETYEVKFVFFVRFSNIIMKAKKLFKLCVILWFYVAI